MPNYVQGPPFPRGLYRGDKGYSFGALTAVAITSLSRNANGAVTCVTTAPHKALPGEIATIVGSVPVGTTRFDGNYFIQAAAFGSSTLTLIPLDDIVLHQAVDTATAGGTISLIQMEQPAALTAGRAFGLMNSTARDFASTNFAVDGVFDGAPGAFEIDVQVAELDVPSLYQTAPGGNIVAVDATNNTFHFDANTSTANFVRAFLRSRTNAVNLAVSIRG